MNRLQWLNDFFVNVQSRLGGARLETSIDLYEAMVDIAHLREGGDPRRVSIRAFETPPVNAGARAVAGQMFEFNIETRTPKQAADEVVDWLGSMVEGLQYGRQRALIEGPMEQSQAAQRVDYYSRQKPTFSNPFCEMVFVQARLVQDGTDRWYCIAIGDPIGH